MSSLDRPTARFEYKPDEVDLSDLYKKLQESLDKRQIQDFQIKADSKSIRLVVNYYRVHDIDQKGKYDDKF